MLRTFFIAHFLLLVHFVSSESLYNPKDPLWELDAHNFDRIVLNKTNAWIIEFYASWCGHCIRFAPHWKEFARDVENWKPVIEVGVVNCADEINLNLCRQHRVTGYPNIQLFEPNLKQSGISQIYNDDRDLSVIRAGIINFLQNLRTIPTSWPSLTEIRTASLSAFWKSVPASVSQAFLVIEHPGSYLGREIILDLSGQKNAHIVRALRTNTHLMQELNQNLDDKSSSIFVKISRNGRNELLNVFSNEFNGTFTRDLIFEMLVGKTRVQDPTTDDDQDVDVTIRNGVYMADLENAIRSILYSEIPVQSMISGEKFTALVDFIAALRMYFPGSPNVVGFLIKLNTWLDNRKMEGLTGQRFLATLDNLKTETEYIPKSHPYVGCKGSIPKYRGYPCSLWTLFHAITVQAYNKHDQPKKDIVYPKPQQVLFAIRGFVKHFFSCEECSKHFQQMSANLEAEADTPKDSILWLWQAHNQVNKRLAGDDSEDPIHPKQQFPSVKECPKCRISSSGDNILWDEFAVLRYLQFFYKKETIVPVEVKEAKQRNFHYDTGKANRLTDFSMFIPLLSLYRQLGDFY